MKRIALSIATVAALAACTNATQASDLTELLRVALGTNHYSYRHAAQHAHADHHADLQYREIEREAVHHAAHHQPLTVPQHVRLHNDLGHAAYHDAVEHDTAHVTRAYSPRYIQHYRSVPYGYGAQYRPLNGPQRSPAIDGGLLGCSWATYFFLASGRTLVTGRLNWSVPCQLFPTR
ncbi:MAG: hypothetical protein HYV60_03075 [Planctomycetia bacterium]|nr:hypothetical protein [Planctomycetia bacterium]